MHVDECGAPERLAGRQAAHGRRPSDGKLDPGRRRPLGVASAATSTTCSRASSRSPRRPSSAPSTRPTRSARSPTRRTRSACYLHVDGARLANAAAALDVVARASSPPRPAWTSSPSAAPRTALLFGDAVVFCGRELAARLRVHPQAAVPARLEDALCLRPVRGAARAATSGCAAPATRTRWRRGSADACGDVDGVEVAPPGRGQRRLRPPAARRRSSACWPSSRASTRSTSGTRPRRGALDVRLGHDGGDVDAFADRVREAVVELGALAAAGQPPARARLRALTSSPAQASSASSDSHEEARKATTPALEEAWYGRRALSAAASATAISRCRSSAGAVLAGRKRANSSPSRRPITSPSRAICAQGRGDLAEDLRLPASVTVIDVDPLELVDVDHRDGAFAVARGRLVEAGSWRARRSRAGC